MKKIYFCIALLCLLILPGCGKKNEEEVIERFIKKINSTSSYHIEGNFEIINNEEHYTYDINVDFKADNNFKVSLINRTNNHEQIILRNSDGVYVLTPSLNKSFKFQSDWPYNNSQTYILQSIKSDLENDSEKDFKETENGYMITTSVDYSNKQDLVKQNIYFDRKGEITKIEVSNSSDQIKIVMNFSKIEYEIKFNDDNFNVDKNVFNGDNNDTVSQLEGVIFPMYVPTDTYLTSQDVISINGGQRAILTFNGEKPFTIIQETASSNDLLNVNVEGKPHIIMDTVGVLSDSYVLWINNGIEYHVISDELTQQELLNVANSISVMPVSK